jgi:holo-[acyl-carrier protein] synthase
MVYGIGVDLVSIERMQTIIQKQEEAFIQRVLSAEEWQTWQQKVEGKAMDYQAAKLAKYWAAKEATSKAFGTGFAQGIGWRDIGLQYNEAGKPFLVYQAKAQRFIIQQGIIASHISFSDEQAMVIAVVILEK